MTPEQCADAIIAEVRVSERHAFAYYRPEMVKLIGQAIAAEREACASLLDEFANIAATANESFIVIGDAENAERHRMRRETFLSAAAAIRARGDTPDQ